MKAVVIDGLVGGLKSQVAFALAKALSSSVLIADTTQLYSKFTLGTYKPSEHMQKAVQYHLLGKYDPKQFSSLQPLTMWQYRSDALAVLRQLWKEKQVPVIEGGAHLYVQGLIYGKDGIDTSEIPADMREKAMKIIEEYKQDGWELCLSKLQLQYPGLQVKCKRNDYYRLGNALMRVLAGKPPAYSYFSSTPLFDARTFYLTLDGPSYTRDVDYSCQRAVESGLVQDTVNLILSGDFNCKEVSRKLPENSPGYAQTWQYLKELMKMTQNGEVSEEDLLGAFYDYLRNYISAVKAYTKHKTKLLRSNAAELVPIHISLDSYSQPALASISAKVLEYTAMSRDAFDAVKGTPVSMLQQQVEFERSIDWAVYPRRTPAELVKASQEAKKHIELIKTHRNRLAELGL